MKKIITTILLLVSIFAFAQGGALADLKFEEVEIAFNKQDYETTIKKLDEFDKVFGSVTSKSLYLRIVSQDIIHDYYDIKSPILINLSKNTNAYLKAFQEGELNDRYREVYAISERVNKALEVKKWKEASEYLKGVNAHDRKAFDEAINWLKKAEPNGNLAATHYIGIIKNGQKNQEEAIEYFYKAANAGYTPAMRIIAQFLYSGIDGILVKNQREALEWFLKAAENGDSEANYYIGVMYYYGEGAEINKPEAYKWYLKATYKGNADAMEAIAMQYHSGQGVTQDFEKAMYWYKKALDKGNTPYNNIGALYYSGSGVSKDYAVALSWFVKAANAGSMMASNSVGEMYLDGEGVEKNYNEALNWFKKASESNSTEHKERAKKGIGTCYYELGNDFFNKHDYTNALENYKNAFSYDKISAKYKIAEMYRNGFGVEKNKKTAKEWENKMGTKMEMTNSLMESLIKKD